MSPDSKLYVVVRDTLSAGLKAAQACHALRAFVGEYPVIDAEWHRDSNNIAILEYPDLDGLAARLEQHGMALSRFHEPDQDGDLTAICVTPVAKRMLRHLPLACAA